MATADPTRLLVMLCDRLVLDVQRALTAQQAGDRAAAHHQLLHAQDIVMELRGSLKTDGFAGAQQLAAIYDFLHQQLVTANIRGDQEITAHCLTIVQQLADTWRQAAAQQFAATA